MSTVPYGTNFQVEVTGDGEKWESTQREGDFEGEQRVARRIAELGLVECKRNLELELRRRIEDSMCQDDIVSALDVCKRRRPLSDRMQSVVDTILHVIRYRIRDRTADDDKILQSTTAKICEIKVLMGVFTSNVSHEVDFENRVVILTGHTPCSPKLTKEIRLQMPKRADVSYLVARYTAGVYEIIAPYEEGDHSIQIAQNIANIVHYNSDADNNYLGESRIEDGLYEIPVIGKSEYNTVTKADLSTTRSNNDLENVPDNVPAKSEILHYVQACQ